MSQSSLNRLDAILATYADAQCTVMNAERNYRKNPTPVNWTAWRNAQEQLTRTPQQLELPLQFPGRRRH